MKRWTGPGRVAAATFVIGGGVAYAGLTYANTPAVLQTCSHVSKGGNFGPPHLLHSGATCAGKTVLQTWVDQRYEQIMEDAAPGAGTASTSYSGFDFANMSLPDGGVSGSTAGDHIGDFTKANFSHAGLFRAVWDNDDFQGATFNGATMTNSTFHSDNFSDANLSNASLSGADFAGSDMASVVYFDTICPNGSSSASHIVGGAQTCAGQGGSL